MQQKTLTILGCGWLGKKIIPILKPYFSIYGTTQTESSRQQVEQLGAKAQVIDFNTNDGSSYQNIIDDSDAVIISLPVSKKQANLQATEHISSLLESFKGNLFLFSSIGIYPQDNQWFTEDNHLNLNENILAIETAYRHALPQINILRLAGLMGDERRFSNYFKDKAIPNPHQGVNHIHYEDIAQVIKVMIEQNCHSKLLNIVAPEHPTKQQVYTYQTEGVLINPERVPSRLVSSEKLISEFNYNFIHPNPIYFK